MSFIDDQQIDRVTENLRVLFLDLVALKILKCQEDNDAIVTGTRVLDGPLVVEKCFGVKEAEAFEVSS